MQELKKSSGLMWSVAGGKKVKKRERRTTQNQYYFIGAIP
jgi:hypothetical protein